MKIPKYIEFHNETNSLLSRYLKEAEPAEGCAILIGHKNCSGAENKNNFWEIKHIWKCSNIWGEPNSKLITQSISKLPDQKDIELSKRNRFEVDAIDYISAQKWARKHDLEILCCAHSHPLNQNTPSETDLFWHKSPGLMVIANKTGHLKAWWIKNKFNFHRVKIKVLSLT